MHFDPDHDDSLADDLFAVIERAIAERQHALSAVLSVAFNSLHDGTTRELAELIRPHYETFLVGAMMDDGEGRSDA